MSKQTRSENPTTGERTWFTKFLATLELAAENPAVARIRSVRISATIATLIFSASEGPFLCNRILRNTNVPPKKTLPRTWLRGRRNQHQQPLEGTMTEVAPSSLPASQEPQDLELVDVVFSGKKGSYDVRVYIKDRGRSHDQPGRSTKGTIDAIANAIRLMIPHDAKLVAYDIATNGGGTDAVAYATIVLKDAKGTYSGEGEDTDTPHAAARAYLEAVSNYRNRSKS